MIKLAIVSNHCLHLSASLPLCLSFPPLILTLYPAEFTREVTDTQMPLVAPVILPEMYKIFTMAEVWCGSPGLV